VPLPAHWLRRLARGRDPVSEIAAELSRSSGLPVRRAIRRSRWTRRQTGLPRRRRLAGVIVERAPASAYRGRLAPIEHLIDAEPVLSPALLGVLRQAAIDCLCPIGLALASALPAGSAPRSARGFELTARGREALAAPGLAQPARDLLARLARGPAPAAALRRAATGASGPGAIDSLLRDLVRDDRHGSDQAQLRPLQERRGEFFLFGGADAEDLGEFVGGSRTPRRHVDQRTVGEDHVGGHLARLGQFQAQHLQAFQQFRCGGVQFGSESSARICK